MEESEIVKVVERLCGVAIALLFILPIFNVLLGIDFREFFYVAGADMFKTVVAK
jgi:hypothetical protein